MDSAPDTAVALFEEHRPFLQSLCYRMVGILAEAEDIVQETWLRWAAAPVAEVAEPRAFLARTATRLCLDYLKSARVRRVSYVGEWLPEPLPQEEVTSMEAGEDVSFALLHAMERLTPAERAAFLLHDVFGESFEQIGDFLNRPAATCRQLATRARRHVRAEAPRHAIDPGEGHRIAAAFLRAAREGDLSGLKALLQPAAVLFADGGGFVRAARRPIRGYERISRMFASLVGRKSPPEELHRIVANGLPGAIYVSGGRITDVLLLVLEPGGRIERLYMVRNPEKLTYFEEKWEQNAGSMPFLSDEVEEGKFN